MAAVYNLRSRTKPTDSAESSSPAPKTLDSPAAQTAGSSLSTSISTGRSLVLLQLLSRLVTFALNQSLVRLASPEVFGTASIQFDLICSSIEYLSREGIRNALLRRALPNDPKGKRQDAALSIMPFRLGLVVSALLAGVYLYNTPSSTSAQPSFYTALGLYVGGSLAELFVEPLAVRALREDPPRIHVRVQAQGGMAIVKAVVTVCSLVLFERIGTSLPLLAFGLGQLAGQIWLAARYILEYRPIILDLLWSTTPAGEERYDEAVWGLAMANSRQGVAKQLLTEADRIAVGRICPLEDQGGYAVAMNYGSLVARIVFQPLEETLLLHFSSSLHSASTLPLLVFVLRLSLHLLVLLLAFLPPLLPALIPFLLPQRYRETSAPSTLATYLTWYIPLLSLNGLLEAFHASSASPEQVALQARWMMGSSAAFVAALFGFRTLAPAVPTEKALILSSCMGMLVRIAYALWHARAFFGKTNASQEGEGFRLSQILPSKAVILTAGGSGVLLWYMSNRNRWSSSWSGWFQLIGVGGVLGLTTLFMMWIEENKHARRLGSALGGQKLKAS